MARYVAFLRGFNVSRRRVSQDKLRTAFERMGFREVDVYGGSGNVIFTTEPARVVPTAMSIGRRSEPVLGSGVVAFLRTASEVRAIAALEPFDADALAASEGKIEVVILAARPSQQVCAAVLATTTTDDRLVFEDRELYWLPRASPANSALDRDLIARLVGPMTFRTKRTVEQIALRLFPN